MSDEQKVIEWKERGKAYQLMRLGDGWVLMGRSTMLPFNSGDSIDTWGNERVITDHEAACLRACHGHDPAAVDDALRSFGECVDMLDNIAGMADPDVLLHSYPDPYGAITDAKAARDRLTPQQDHQNQEAK